MKHYSFDVDIAIEYGVSEAIIISNLQFWIEKNKANGKHLHNKRTWTYNSYEAFTKLFPFWSLSQIKRTMARLVEKGVLLKANYNKKAYDKTNWYAFKNEELFLSNRQNRTIDETKSSDGSNEIVQPIPDSKPINKQHKQEVCDLFLKFWKEYPKRVDKKKAELAFNRLTLEKKEKAIKEIGRLYSKIKEVKFIPSPLVYINGEKWEDESISFNPVKETKKQDTRSLAETFY